jgi:hypothetical protein
MKTTILWLIIKTIQEMRMIIEKNTTPREVDANADELES